MDPDGMPSSPIRATARRPSDCPPLEINDHAVASGSGSGLGDMAPPPPPSQQVRRPTSRQTRRPSSSSLSQQDMASDCAGPSDPLACKRIKLSTSTASNTSTANEDDGRPSRRRVTSTSSKMVSTMSDHSPNRAERNESAMKDIIQDLMVTSRRQPADAQDVREPQRPLTARTRLRLNRQHFDSAFPPVSAPNGRSWPASAIASSSSSSLPIPQRTPRRKRASSVPLSPPLDHAAKRRRKTDRLSPSPSDSQAYNCQVTVACKTPPINLQSMRSLDARHVLQDPQIRHDGLFDSIGFLPASSFQPASVLPGSALAPQLVLEARIRDITSEMYWESIRAELRDGCRCTRWVVPKDASWPHGLAIDRRVKMRDCICGKWMTDKNEHQWVKAQHGNIYASRLPALFHTLRQIIESLMGSTTPAQTASTSASTWASAGPACTVAHPMVPHLLSVLDPEHLTLQVRRGADCTPVFELLGEAMKLHCAPVRDSIVEAMIQLAREGCAGASSDSMAAALAKSFDCLEIMKLDIVNHQIRAMRPFLWREAPLNEMAAFHETLAVRGLTLQTSRTQAWIRSASERVLRRAPAAQRVHLLGKCTCARRSDFAAETMAEAFIELVMADWTGDAAWPPSVHRRGKQPALDSGIGNVQLPEALQFDARRIRAFNAQTIDIAIQQAVLLGCRQIMRARTPDLPAHEVAARLALVQSDIRAAVTHTNAPLTAVLPDLTLHMAYRMAGVDPTTVADAGTDRSLDDRLALDRLSVAVRDMIARDTARTSPVLAACQSAVRRYLAVMLTHDLFAVRFDSQSTLYDLDSALLTCEHQQQAAAAATAATSASESSAPEGVHPARQARSAAAGGRAQKDAILSVYQQAEAAELNRLHLAPLKPQLHDLLRRMVDIACFNFAIFKQVYLVKGMMLGA